MDLIEATMKALQGKLEEKPNKANAEINAKILEPNANKAELQKNGYNVSRANGFTSVKRADRVNDFREVSVFDDGTVMTVNDDTIIDKPVNKDVFDAKSFLDTDRKKPYEAPNKVSKFKMNKDTIAQADEEIADAEREKKDNPEDADILDKNVIEPWKKLKDKADAENKEMLNKQESRRTLGEHVIVENKECLKEETLTWEDIMDNAEGTTFGQQALKVKDQARAEVEELMRKDGIDVDNLENVEDEIEKYVVDHNIKFADNGCILKEAYGPNVNYKNIKVGDNVLKYLRGNAVNGTITKIDTIGAGGMSSDYAIIEFEDGSTSKVATQDIHPEKYDGKYRDYSIYLLNESVVSDYTLSEIKKILDSEETEYGYSLKITNNGADAETKTLDLDKSDLQAIYDALSKNKVTESKLEETVENSTDNYTTNLYYIELPSGMFGITYKTKEEAIKTFTDLIEKEKNIDGWKEQAEEYEKLIADGKVQVVTVTKNVEAITTTEILKLDNGNVQLGEAKVYTPDTMGKDYDNYTDTFNKLQKDIKDLPDANLDYKGICSLIAGYIEGVVGIEDNPEAMSKINIDLVREIADAVFNEDDVWEPMDDFIYSEIYAKLGIE